MTSPFVASYVLFLVMLPTYTFLFLMKLTDMHISSNATFESWLDNNTQLDADFKQILWCTMQTTRGSSVLHTHTRVSQLQYVDCNWPFCPQSFLNNLKKKLRMWGEVRNKKGWVTTSKTTCFKIWKVGTKKINKRWCVCFNMQVYVTVRGYPHPRIMATSFSLLEWRDDVVDLKNNGLCSIPSL